ncbi:nuclease-related domain-containing protein [Streptomyces sp. NPDC058622]|uniref:nuclease-related domain-containing protein n=1 Tax=Streptomyces sp. NPDC058622 TaxID=3346562 RepID=UPI003657EEC3
MAELKVSRWRKSGHDRLYVNLPGGSAVAWADCRTGRVTVLVEAHRRAATALLEAYLADLPEPAAPLPGPPPKARPVRAKPPAPPAPPAARRLPPLSAPDDLALNRPGSGIQEMLRSKGPGRVRRALDRVLRRETEWDPWFKGLAGERIVGAELDRLTARGWRVLHSIPLTRGGDIDHLLVGPGGVFTVNTKNFRGRSVWIGDDVVKVDHGPPHPYPAKSRAEAKHARGILERHCPFPVEVEPVLVFVGARDLPKETTQLQVRVYREREVAALGPLTGRLAREQIDLVYAVARHRKAWLTT